MDQRKVDAVVNEAVEMHQKHVKIASVTQIIAHTALTELAWRFYNTNYLNYGSLSTEKLLELTPKLVKMHGDGADMERLARGFEAKGAEPNSTPMDINSFISNPELLILIEALIEQKSKGMTSPRENAKSEDEKLTEGEGPDDSGKGPARRPILKRRDKADHGNSSQLENQQAEPRPLNEKDEKGDTP